MQTLLALMDRMDNTGRLLNDVPLVLGVTVSNGTYAQVGGEGRGV